MRPAWTNGLVGVACFAAFWTVLRWQPDGASEVTGARSAGAVATEREGGALLDPIPPRADGAPTSGEVGSEARSPDPREAATDVSSDPGPAVVRVVLRAPWSEATRAVSVFAADAAGLSPAQGTKLDQPVLFSGMAPGPFRLWTYSIGARAADAVVEVEAGGIHEVELELAPATLVRVRAGDGGGRPLRDVVASTAAAALNLAPVATTAPPGPVLDPPFAGGNNGYGIGAWWDESRVGLEPSGASDAFGVLVVDGEAPFHASLVIGQVVVATRQVARAEESVEFVVSEGDLEALTATLAARVVAAETGAPIAAAVRLVRRYSRRRTSVETDAEGFARFDGIWAGPITAVVTSAGYATAEVEVTLRPGEHKDLGDIVLGEPVTVEGVVRGPEGEALSVMVACELLGDDLRPVRGWRETSDAGGAVSFGALPSARYAVRIVGDDEVRRPGAARTAWTSQATLVDARAGTPEPFTLRAERPTEVAIDLEGVPRNARIEVRAANGLVLRSLRVARPIWALRLPQGPVTLGGEGLEPGIAIEVTDEPRRVRIGR